MSVRDLLKAHQYSHAELECRRVLSSNPDDIAAMANLAAALLAMRRYEEALPLFERVDADERADKIARGRPGRRKEMSCIHWFLGDRAKAIALMRGLVDGILDRSIQYGDAAGGVQQGFLLYYMAIMDRQPETASFALDYLRNRAKRFVTAKGLEIKVWPAPMAQYYLGRIDFSELLTAATGFGELRAAIAAADDDILSRRQLCVALFHDGVMRRAEGAEELCLGRMRQCYALEDPLIELEWYLARYEVENARIH
jgi:hypothetical protein